MLCDVCGRNNADNLTFCQDCGRRLRQQRGVAPTPPNGVAAYDGGAALAVPDAMPNGVPAAFRPPLSDPPRPPSPSEPSPESNRGSSPSGPPSGGRRARPAAPVFSFSPQMATEPPRRPSPPPVPVPADAVAAVRPVPQAQAATVICTECRSPNPPEYRFCVTCGAPLKRAVLPGEPTPSPAARPAPIAEKPAARPVPVGESPKPRPVPMGESPQLPPPSPPAPPSPTLNPGPYVAYDGDKIVGAPVVDIAASGMVPTKIVSCARCHGHCVAGTRFCKYCGAPLDETRGRPAGTNEPATPAPSAAPPPLPPPFSPSPSAPSPAIDSPRSDLGKIPLVPVNKPVPSPSGSGLRAAMNPPTPMPGALMALSPPAPDPTPRPSPQDAGFTPKVSTPIVVQSAGPPPLPVDAPRPVVVRAPHDGGSSGRVWPKGSSALPSAAHIENAVREAEPGVRSEISALAGSPVPAAPMIPSPPPPREPREREAEPRPGARAAPVVAAARWQGGRLVVIVEDGSEGRSFSLAEGQLDVGRTDGDIVLEDDPYVSPRHARLRRIDGGWLLRDLDSTNHVYVRLRKPHPLRDGDLLLLGLEVLQFQTVSDGERGLGHAMQHGTFLFGSPATPRRARLCQRTVEGVIRDVYHLFRDETIIGREVGDIVFTADPFLSRRHAAIRRNPVTSEFALVDLDSSNGTYVAIRGEVPIADGDFLRIGQHLFRVDLG